jgi:molecular chaperone GrpE (heat shock protein)
MPKILPNLRRKLIMTKQDNTVRDKILKGMELVHKKLIKSKKDRNLCLVVSANGSIVRIQPNDK